MQRISAVVATTILTAGLLAGTPSVQAQDGGDLVELCGDTAGAVPEAGPRACRSLLSLTWIAASACRHAGAPEDLCSQIDGRTISEARMQAYEDSWVHRAHTLQRELDDATPLRHALVPGSHNSNNAFAYWPPTLSGSDANHVYSIRDQLRMDMRSLELDLHWAPSAEGSPEHGMKAPILCHGASAGSPPAMVHAGCTIERHVRHGFAEIREWFDDNPGEFLLLYLENQLDGDPVAHALAAEAIDEELGDLVYRPVGESCAPMPTAMSRDDVRATGARILIVGNCDAGDAEIASTWGSWVHERAQNLGVWSESGGAMGTVYPDEDGCDAERAQRNYEETFIRRFEGGTWLQAMTATGGDITLEETRRMVRCGVNLFGFDHLTPEDPRLAALVWSWAPEEPVAGGCAYQGADGRFRSDDCEVQRPFACFDGAGWRVSEEAGTWTDGPLVCDGDFGVPSTGYDNRLLERAKPSGIAEVWLDYALTDVD